MKKLSLLIVIGSISTLTFLLQAQQNTYSRVYYFLQPEIVTVRSAVQSFDNTYLLSGNASEKGLIINIDSLGNMLWNKEFSSNNLTNYPNFTFNCIIRTFDSCFLIGGSVFDTIASYSNAFYMKMKINGDTIWSKAICLTNLQAKILSVQQTYDSGYIMTGYTAEPTLDNFKILVARIDSEGNLLWTRVLWAGNNTNVGYSVKQTPDSCFIVTGHTENINPFVTDAFLIKFYPNGAISWSKKYNITTSGACFGKDVMVTNDGYLLYLNVYDHITFVKTDFGGNILWTKAFDQHAGYALNLSYTQKIYLASDSSYYFVSGDQVVSGISKMDTSGNLLWTHQLDLAAVDVLESNNKEYFIVGNGPMMSIKSPKFDGLYVGLIQTDSLGDSQYCVYSYPVDSLNYSANSYPVNFTSFIDGIEKNIHPSIDSVILQYYDGCVGMGLGVNETWTENDSHVFPNPSTGIFTFSNSRRMESQIYICNITGQQIFNSHVIGQLFKIDLSAHPNGIYFYKMILSDNTILHGKLIITR